MVPSIVERRHMKAIRQKFYLSLLALGLCTSAAFAQSPGTFTPTGNMTTGRYFHSATLLADGRVLVAGGAVDLIPGNPRTTIPLSSAEIYDPHTGVFTATGNMTTARAGHTATLLPDGKVLISGGGGYNAATLTFADPTFATSELYDPNTGTFSAAGSMTTPRYSPTATLLKTGTVMIAG